MVIDYVGAKELSGPLLIFGRVPGIFNEEMAEIRLPDGEIRQGRVVGMDGEHTVIQLFQGTSGISLSGVRAHFTGRPVELALSREILGRMFDGAGRPADGLGPVYSDLRRDINGLAINPVSRTYPRNYICTGISSIDVLITLIRGQKLPIFSGSGMAHNELAVQIARQARLAGEDAGRFCIVFAAMGVKNDVADYFRRSFEEAGVLPRVVMFRNLASDPIVERILTPRCALTAAEYLAYEENMHVLVILTDMTAYAEALREFSSSKGEIPGRKGYPGYLYSDLASLYERAGIVEGRSGSVTQLPILTMPNDDITHPIPDLTGYITEGQIVLDRALSMSGIYPPVAILPSLSRLMKDGIGEGYTRADHAALSGQLFASYARVMDARSLASVIGEEELSELDKQYIRFGRLFEEKILMQGHRENRSMEESLKLCWQVLSTLPKSELSRMESGLLDAHYVAGAQTLFESGKTGQAVD